MRIRPAYVLIVIAAALAACGKSEAPKSPAAGETAVAKSSAPPPAPVPTETRVVVLDIDGMS